MTSDLRIGFIIKEHPALGYKLEDRIDLEHAWSSDVTQGAFMGDVIFSVGDANFGTPPQNSAWRGLVEWCLRLDSAVRKLGAGEVEVRMSEPDSGDFMTLRNMGGTLLIAASCADVEAEVGVDEFLEAAVKFLSETISWISSEYPAVKRNKDALKFWKRLDVYMQDS